MAQTKKSKKKSVDKKHTKSKAKKALAQAERSVEAASRAVRNSTKKLKAKAATLSKQTKKLSAKQSKAARELAAQKNSVGEAAKLDLPKAPAPKKSTNPAGTTAPQKMKLQAVLTPSASGTDKSTLTPPLPAPAPAAPTLVELRERAKVNKIPRYYRLNKAALVKALDVSQST